MAERPMKKSVFQRTGVFLPTIVVLTALFAITSPVTASDTTPRVGRINIVGNEGITSSRILGVMTLAKRRFFILPRHFDDLELDNDIRRISDLYRKSGYIHAVVAGDSIARRGATADITIEVREETRVFLRSVSVEGASGGVDPRELAALIRMKAGRPIDLAEAGEARARILKRLAEAGYAFAELRQIIVENESQADLVFRVTSGPAVFLREIQVTGNRMVTSAAITREARLGRGALLRRRDLVRAQRALASRDLFRTVSVAPVRPHDAAASMRPGPTVDADLAIAVEEKPLRWIAARAGYGSADEFHGGFEWGHRNINGEGRRISFEGAVSATRMSGATTLREPWPLRLISTGRLRLSATDEIREAFTEHKEAFLAGAELPLGEFTVGDLSIEAARTDIRKTLPGTQDVIRGDLEKDLYQTVTTAGVMERNTYDDRSFPRSGSHGRLRGEVTLVDLEAWKIEGSVGRAHSLGENLVAAGALSAGVVRGFGRTRDVPSTLRFFLGGPESLRGFRKDDVGPQDAYGQPIGGALFVLAQGELRFFPTDKGHGVLFLDIGQVVRRASDLDLKDLVASPGVGLRYHTPFGPIRLDYAWPYAGGKFGVGRINFAVGYAF